MQMIATVAAEVVLLASVMALDKSADFAPFLLFGDFDLPFVSLLLLLLPLDSILPCSWSAWSLNPLLLTSLCATVATGSGPAAGTSVSPTF